VDANDVNTGASGLVCLPPEMKDGTTLSRDALLGEGPAPLGVREVSGPR